MAEAMVPKSSYELLKSMLEQSDRKYLAALKEIERLKAQNEILKKFSILETLFK